MIKRYNQFINEDLSDYLIGPNIDDIKNSNLSGDKLLDLGVTMNNIELVKLAIEKGVNAKHITNNFFDEFIFLLRKDNSYDTVKLILDNIYISASNLKDVLQYISILGTNSVDENNIKLIEKQYDIIYKKETFEI